ncbi:MAG TPA: hypothetical protein VFB13_17925 [Reyranella sp.]|nr:hypothetical protein [Reyranella sp.]
MPSLGILLKAAPWVLCALLGLGLLWCRGQYESEVAARAADQLAAQQAVAAKQEEAKKAADAAIAANQRADQVRAETHTVFVDRILHDAPSACPPSAAARDAAEFVRQTIAARPAGGPPAQ